MPNPPLLRTWSSLTLGTTPLDGKVEVNARCALARLPPGTSESVEAALVREGFHRHDGAVASRPLRGCPSGDDDLRDALAVFRRSSSNGREEFAAVDKQGRFIFAGTREPSAAYLRLHPSAAVSAPTRVGSNSRGRRG